MTDDDWLTTAMADTALVAELLLTLRLSTLPSTSKRRRPAPPQSWTIHQRRSRTQPLLPASNKSETPRASPNTPLSWSGATSLSGGGGVPILEPNHNRSDSSRSKVMPPGETTPTKRPRKKKTLAALKEEEVLLTVEQNHLKRQVEALQANYEKQRKENESLMQMKMAIQVESQKEVKDKIVLLPDLNVPAGEEVIMSY